ncbi:MAG: hypothetical protein BWX86_00387 [Verrucomicrobia bacterium ADurb.Bin122]|nr:MAG: hypothetical protein BWX86_00387 [Verrucomicrobia bacterium ADurb.Bin122]
MRAMHASASGVTCTFSSSAIFCSRCTINSGGIGFRSKRWQRETIVGSTFCGSVVAKTNFTCSGGSSSVLSSALNAAAESMCTSSMM